MKIAITGHRPDTFLISHYLIDTVKRIASDTVCVFQREFKDDLMFILGGALGADQYVGMGCIEHNTPYKMYLPFHPIMQTKYWTKDDRNELDRQLSLAMGIDIIDPNIESVYNAKRYQERNIKMVDESNIVVAFWVGRRQGGTFNTIQYALNQSKFVFNALDNNRPIFKDDLNNGWTPPFLRKNNE